MIPMLFPDPHAFRSFASAAGLHQPASAARVRLAGRGGIFSQSLSPEWHGLTNTCKLLILLLGFQNRFPHHVPMGIESPN